jgi:pyruvate/2-oxoglutarate dehydrogenase complex dihydrolipoamide dehydrogenase (E3) component
MARPGSERFDAIVIGAGQGGGPLSTTLAGSGRKTVLVESTHIGGTCINEGCTPTKTMVASARVAYLARRGTDYGVDTGSVTIDQRRVWERTHQVVNEFRRSGEEQIVKTPGLEWIKGEGVFIGDKTLEVRLKDDGTRTIAADLIVIDTGTRPAVPKLPGFENIPFLTSTTILELQVTPRHLLILGGGTIALEFAQMFSRFGSEVTVIVRGSGLLPKEDDEIAKAMTQILTEDGITFLFGTNARGVAGRDGDIQFTVERDGTEQTLSGTHLLVATGRTPNTDVLAPAATGVKTDERGFIQVDERLATNVPGIYAIGDVNGGPEFTHISYDDFRILRTNLIEGGSATTKGRLVPWCIYTDPELGRIGLTERDARDQGKRVKVATLPMSSVARAKEMDETRGLMKAVVDAESGKILGGAVLGVGGGELMSMMELAIRGGLTARDLANGIFSHPTLAESLNNLFTQVVD